MAKNELFSFIVGGTVRILTEASGSLTSAYLMKAIRDAGHIPVGSDIEELTAACCLADDFILFPKKDSPKLWEEIDALLIKYKIDVVIPSFDEMMIGWATQKEYFENKKINIIISPVETIETFGNKWKTYLFFKKIGVPCPATSLKQDYPLIKPIHGRGTKGIKITDESVNMDGMISQEIVTGEEYTIDCFFDYKGDPVYVVPRKRLYVREGKSTKGIVIKNDQIVSYVTKIAQHIKLVGPINMQCFCHGENLKFIEVNPRIAGGMALGFAATENWIKLIIDNILNKQPIKPIPIHYGLKMVRYYAECFVS